MIRRVRWQSPSDVMRQPQLSMSDATKARGRNNAARATNLGRLRSLARQHRRHGAGATLSAASVSARHGQHSALSSPPICGTWPRPKISDLKRACRPVHTLLEMRERVKNNATTSDYHPTGYYLLSHRKSVTSVRIAYPRGVLPFVA